MNYICLKRETNEFFNILKDRINEANDLQTQETNSCITIQKNFRGTSSRSKVSFRSRAANEIERVFRGHMGRKKSRLNNKIKLNLRQFLIMHYFALQVQRSYRGFYSRKYRANHSKRKEFMKQTLEKAIEIRKQLYIYATDQALREEKEYQEKKTQEFKNYAENLHHLVSTHSIPGVLNPNPDFIDQPTMRSKPVEEYVRGYVRDLLRTRGIAKSGLVIDLHGSRKIPLKGIKSRLSIQASSTYEFDKKENKLHLQKDKLAYKLQGKTDFKSGGRTKILNQVTESMTNGDPYLDPWANPLLVKGVPKSQEEFNETAFTRKALHVTHLDRPFYTRADGNKSTCHPNGVFDIIADAEETGGAIQRQIGNTHRFGVPSTADKRPMKEVPASPIRVSTIRKPRQKVIVHKIHVKPIHQSLTTMSSQFSPSQTETHDDGSIGSVESNSVLAYDSSSDEDGVINKY
jgi:hypothetical protein